MAPRETENNAYAKFWGDKQRALWYVMVFSGVVNSTPGVFPYIRQRKRDGEIATKIEKSQIQFLSNHLPAVAVLAS